MPRAELDTILDRAAREPDGGAGRVLRCAEALFAERGFDGVTTREVAAAAGVNVATLHFHWSDKRTLYEAVCRRQARQLLRFLEAAPPPEDPSGSPAEGVEDWVERSFALLAENPAIAPLAWQSVSGQSAPDLPTLLQHDVGVFRRLQSALRDATGVGGRDATFALLALFYFAIGLFSDSPLQRAVLRGSVHRSRPLRRDAVRFARRLARLLVTEGPASREASR